jgi:hypothetical protein
MKTIQEIESLKDKINASHLIKSEFPTLKDKIRAEKKNRQDRYDAFARLYELADENGKDRAEVVRPEPMIVKDEMTGHVYPPVMDGVCGFAWVTVRPANSSFARWAKDKHGWDRAYNGGMQLWVHGYGQSYERKLAYAEGFASVLRLAGIRASASGRLD